MNSISTARYLQRVSGQACRCYHAPFRIPRQFSTAQRNLQLQSPSQLLRRKRFSPVHITPQLRHESTQASQPPPTVRPEQTQENTSKEAQDIAERKAQEPSYELTFTCRKCLNRSSHRVTKQAYHFGTTLITCPGCKNRHLISDHLKIFYDKNTTIEDILKEKGQFLKKGRLGDDGDVEFYDETSNEIGRMQQAEKKE